MSPLRLISLYFAIALTAGAQVPNTLIHSIPAPIGGPQAGARLGSRVAVDGGFTVVGAPYDDSVGANAGMVKVFDSTTGTLLFELPNPIQRFGSGGNFGHSVAISGSRVVVGAPQADTGEENTGIVYVFDLSSGTPTVPVVTLNDPDTAMDPVDDGNFGYTVAISGMRVVVGEYRPDRRGVTGNAFVFNLASATPEVPVLTFEYPVHTDYYANSVAIDGAVVVVAVTFDDAGDDGGGDPGAGQVYVYDLGSGTPAVPILVVNKPGPVRDDAFGRSVAISGTRVVVGDMNNSKPVGGAAYVYNLSSATPTVAEFTIPNPSPGALAFFGTSVAISGTRVVISDPYNDTGAHDAGSAYVYDLASTTPTVPVLRLYNPTPAASDFFGSSVTISSTRVVVGAAYDDLGANDAGSAYLYDLGSGTPTVPSATLNNPGPSARDLFGYAMAISGPLMVVGTPDEDTGAESAGSVYVYDLSSATPKVPVFTLHNPAPADFERFGFSVAISGTRIVVGTPYDSTGATYTGRAYVYDLSSATPTVPVATLTKAMSAVYDQFGFSVAISGTRVVIGAPGDRTAVYLRGSAHVYDLSSATPTVPLATLHNPNPDIPTFAGEGQFGYSVAISGTRVVVGAPFDKLGIAYEGSAYVYDLDSGTPTVAVAKLDNPFPDPSDLFGYSVAISGARVVVGAPYGDTEAFNAGSAYVYDLGTATPTVPVTSLSYPSPARSDYFGGSVAISGSRVVVGTHGDDVGAINAGTAFVYDLSSATPSVPVAVFKNPAPADDDSFGYAVAIDGTTVAVGAIYDDATLFNKGSAYVFGPNPEDKDSDGLLDAWEVAYFGTAAGHGPLDDGDSDGLGDLIELAFGTDPTVPDTAAAPIVVNEDGYLTITITRQAGVNYLVEGSFRPESGGFTSTTTTVLLNNETTLKVRDNFPIGTTPGRFLRVQVTAAP